LSLLCGATTLGIRAFSITPRSVTIKKCEISIMTLGIMTLGKTRCRITILSTMTHGITIRNVTKSITTYVRKCYTQPNHTQNNDSLLNNKKMQHSV